MPNPSSHGRSPRPAKKPPAPDFSSALEEHKSLAYRSLQAVQRAAEVIEQARAMRNAIAESRKTRATLPANPPTLFLAPSTPRHAALSASLSPRLRQTLQHLLKGDSEKQIARKLHLSPHTIHLYITALYRHFDVHSRAELLAGFLSAPPL